MLLVLLIFKFHSWCLFFIFNIFSKYFRTHAIGLNARDRIFPIFPNVPTFLQLELIGFPFVTEEINLLVDKAVPENTKKSTSYAVNVFDGKLFVKVFV